MLKTDVVISIIDWIIQIHVLRFDVKSYKWWITILHWFTASNKWFTHFRTSLIHHECVYIASISLACVLVSFRFIHYEMHLRIHTLKEQLSKLINLEYLFSSPYWNSNVWIDLIYQMIPRIVQRAQAFV